MGGKSPGVLKNAIWQFSFRNLEVLIDKRGLLDGWAGFVIAFGNFEGTFYRYAKRYEELQAWQPPQSKILKRGNNRTI